MRRHKAFEQGVAGGVVKSFSNLWSIKSTSPSSTLQEGQHTLLEASTRELRLQTALQTLTILAVSSDGSHAVLAGTASRVSKIIPAAAVGQAALIPADSVDVLQ